MRWHKLPELPEVESIKNELSPYLIGRRFAGVAICDVKPLRQLSAEELCRKVVGQKITSLERRGKYLVFRLSSGGTLIIHLRMSGALLLNPEQVDRYARVVFYLDDGSSVVFTDRRRLGEIRLAENELAIVGKLGPEPLSPEFTPEALVQRLHRRKAPIKAVLLDQTVIAGIGNMYADESLFLAKIHPLRKANTLSPREVQNLYRAIKHVLRSAIESKGASVDTYRLPGGEIGTAQANFKVAHCGGKPCPVCDTPIQRFAIGGRGSYFCPQCQKL